MPKPAQEFFPADSLPWTEVSPGVHERVLARDGELLTRLLRWDPGFDSTATGPVTHDYVEEVYILRGAMHDTRLGRTFGAGEYASRPPGMVHGPWTSDKGCEMLEVRYHSD